MCVYFYKLFVKWFRVYCRHFDSQVGITIMTLCRYYWGPYKISAIKRLELIAVILTGAVSLQMVH